MVETRVQMMATARLGCCVSRRASSNNPKIQMMEVDGRIHTHESIAWLARAEVPHSVMEAAFSFMRGIK